MGRTIKPAIQKDIKVLDKAMTAAEHMKRGLSGQDSAEQTQVKEQEIP